MKLNTGLIKTEMDRQGVTTKQLAELLGMTQQGIYWMFAKESTTIKRVEKIAEALHRSAKDFLI
jgi:transcriptional regulator with XRE-family HTH domain